MSATSRTKLEEKCRVLSKQYAYVAEFNRCSAQIYIASLRLLELMDQNTQKDASYAELVAQMNGAAKAKSELADIWLREAQETLRKMTDELANWSEYHAS